MSHTAHYKISIIGALISSIAFTALAVFAIAPGETLDPVVTHTADCPNGPTDVTCIINPYEGLDLGSILFLDTAGDLSTSPDLFWDNVNGRLGVGTNTPGQKLEVSDVARFTIPTHPNSYTDIRGGESIRIYRSSTEMPGDPGLYIYSDWDQISFRQVSFMAWDDELIRGLQLGVSPDAPGVKKIGLFSGTTIGFDYRASLPPVDGLSVQGDVGIKTITPSTSLQLGPVGVGAGNTGELSFLELAVNGSNYVGFKAPDLLAGNTTYILPASYGSAGQVLSDNGNGVLSWQTVEGFTYSGYFNSNMVAGQSAGTQLDPALSLDNLFIGIRAGQYTTMGWHNLALGLESLNRNTTGNGNVALGRQSLLSLQTGSSNVAIGHQSGYDPLDINFFPGTGNILIGSGSNVQTHQASYGIAIGANAKTHAGSIALGASATNTKTNQFMIGSGSSPINEIVMIGENGDECVIDHLGANCSSDENLKNSLQPLSATLETLRNIEPIRYRWNSNNESAIGFSAQNIQTYYPELVKEGSQGYLMMNYANMTPILTKAIQELDLKVSILESQTTSSGGFSLASLQTVIKNFLGDIGNGIQNIFAKKIVTEELCVEDVCVTRDQFLQMLENNSVSSSGQQNNNNDTFEEEIDVSEELVDEESNEENTEESLDEEFEEEISEEEVVISEEEGGIEESLDQETDDVQDENTDEEALE